MTDAGDYEALLADIALGARLHYNLPDDEPDRDLALLKGDQAYARGLSRLAELGDLEATRIMADAISLVAQAHADGDAERAVEVWREHADAVRRHASLLP
jgi:hypothetical protein